jgi:hypothetical protein
VATDFEEEDEEEEEVDEGEHPLEPGKGDEEQGVKEEQSRAERTGFRDVPHRTPDDSSSSIPSLAPSFSSFIHPSSWCMGVMAGGAAQVSAWWSRWRQGARRKGRKKRKGGKAKERGEEKREGLTAEKLGEGSCGELVRLIMRALIPVVRAGEREGGKQEAALLVFPMRFSTRSRYWGITSLTFFDIFLSMLSRYW